ncbi:hypothetical protein BDHH15_72300 [Bradyrhizobium diazoefficiens]|uniref:Calcineurin-like phosphoesterase domain-containing protein n=1 Tax=Bradyrhizobium diazoefficiens TaxID=1355477 RepID=A0A809YNV3_9BRAD|nr:hypothetical protein H12S4_75680 [Bradyrhizobium diazoefficiens]BCA24015.1 hypothetical protein BDHH15_72300 [Bradyrhizobium diazoefficiens]BCE42172.1 hypothetical protein XF3B_72030 [Bradyrhizobium diazoefficiens]BCF55570.1 hypothetical protein XF17B_72080 [Bradyrhizobium diazoefficiens]
MKFAAIADVHGNRPALEAVLADIAALGINEVVNLGDHVSGPLEAARTADLLMERGFPSIKGDQDRILVELWQAGTSARSDFRELERKHFEWMASMPSTLMYRGRAFLCHGSPGNDAAFWLDHIAGDGCPRPSRIDSIEAGAEGIDAEIILCAHTHIPRVVRLKDGRLVVNPRQRWIARLRREDARSLRGRGRHPSCVLRNSGACQQRLVRDAPLRGLRHHGHGSIGAGQGNAHLGERDCNGLGAAGSPVICFTRECAE